MLEQLASQPAWQKLLRYEQGGLPGGKPRSAISSADFFLALDGANDPLAELTATLQALHAPAEGPPDSHALCRFPARAKWLKAQLGDLLVPPTGVECPQLKEWTRDDSVSSVSVIFATGYLGNPASYYGHTLLKFNFRGDQSQSSLMDVSVNYGAIVESNDDPLTYIVKGIFGGYDGGFSHINFYFHNHNYGENELRDMWEYQLDLPQEAVDMIVAHAWEVLGKRYTYYFFRRNCAFRMAEILEAAEGLSIQSDWRPWTIPQSLMQSLAAAEYNGHPLLAEVQYHPSRQSRLYDRFQALSATEQALFKHLAATEANFTTEHLEGVELASQQRILDTLLDYYQFIRDRQAGAKDPANVAHRKTLSARYLLPPGLAEVPARTPEPPHTGRAPGWFQLGLSHSPQGADSLSLRLRPAYYDAMDADQGHVRYAALSMGDLRLQMDENGLRLRRLDLIAIDSISPGITGLKGDQGAAWSLKAGIEPQHLDCGHCLVPRIQADQGYGRQLNTHLYAAAYVGGALQESRAGSGPAFARLALRMNLDMQESWGARLRVEQRFPVAGASSPYTTLQLETRLVTAANRDLRLLYEHDRGQELSLGFGWYW